MNTQVNPQGGIDITTPPELQRAKQADLITLPQGVPGTNCGNCSFFKGSKGPVGQCSNPKVILPVSVRMCCAFWDNPGAHRAFK